MGFWDALFGERKRAVVAAVGDPLELRARLFEAAARGDRDELARLTAAHEAMVLAHFPHWKTVPEEVRGDPAALQVYGNGLITVAQQFASARGRPELMALLIGPVEDNPLLGWERALREADDCMERGD